MLRGGSMTELNKCKVVAWKPFPEPYKEKENERY
nr:MAG TPA: Protein of unknown function (DUF551) [Caudoviricetes sp.]